MVQLMQRHNNAPCVASDGRAVATASSTRNWVSFARASFCAAAMASSNVEYLARGSVFDFGPAGLRQTIQKRAEWAMSAIMPPALNWGFLWSKIDADILSGRALFLMWPTPKAVSLGCDVALGFQLFREPVQ